MEKLSEQTQPEPTVSGDEVAHLPRVQHVIKSLVKLVNGKKLYAQNNPRLTQFQDEFRDALEQYFVVEDELVLSVDQYEIRWHDARVYSNEKREDSLAFLLHKDGVGEITIRPRALDAEAERLVQIIAEEQTAGGHGDEDVVTKLWNADFDHISYRVMDDYLTREHDADSSDGPGDELPDQAELLPSLEDKGRVIVKHSDPLESIDGYLNELIMTNCTSSDEGEREQYFQSMVASFFAIDQNEARSRKEERERELRRHSLVAFGEAIIVFTLLQDNPSAVRDVSGVLERIVEHVVSERDAHAMCRMLTLVRDFRATREGMNENVEALCGRLEAVMTEPSLAQSFEAQLDRWAPGTEDVLAYFAAVGRPVVDPLLKILHRAEGARLHREICLVLIQAAGEEIQQVLDKMDIDNPRVALDAVFIAGRIGINALTPRIQELLYYPDRKVKEDMIELVGKMEDPGVPDLLMNAMSDSDRAVRCRAMLVAATRRFPQAARQIAELAFGKDLYEKDPEEQEAVFKALGLVGDAATVDQLRKLVDKRYLMNPTRGRENKMLAIRALEHIQEPSAVDVLERLSRDANENVRSRAARALSALRARMQSASGAAGEASQ